MRNGLAFLAAFLLAVPAARAVDLNVISAVEVKNEGGTVLVTIRGSRPPNFTTFSMMDPPRFVIDISESQFQGVPEDVVVGDDTINVVKNLSYGSAETSIARVMIAFNREVDPPDVQSSGTALVVKVARGAAAPAAQAQSEAELRAQREAQAAAEARDQAAARERAALEARQAEVDARAKAEAEEKARAGEEARMSADSRLAARAGSAAAGAASGAGALGAAAGTAETSSAERERQEKENAELLAWKEKQRREAEEAEAARKKQEEEARVQVTRLDELNRQKAEAEARAREEQEARDRAAEEARQRVARARETASVPTEPTPPPAVASPPAAAASPAPAAEEAPARPERLARVEPTPPAPRRERLVDTGKPRQVKEIGFQQSPESSRVFVRLSDAPSYQISEVSENVIQLELANTRAVRRNDTRHLDTSFFASAVAMVTPRRQGSSYVVEIRLKQKVPYQQSVQGDMLAIDFERPASMRGTAPAAAAPAAPADAPADQAPAEQAPADP